MIEQSPPQNWPFWIKSSFTYSTVWLLESDHEDYESGSRDEEDLHEGVIEWNIVHEQVSISHAENNQVNFLSLTWKA